MAGPVFFTKDWGAWIRDKLNEMSQMVATVAENAAAIFQARDEAVGAAEDAEEDRILAQQAQEAAQQALTDIEDMNLLYRVQALENARMVDQYGDGPYPILDQLFIGPNP